MYYDSTNLVKKNYQHFFLLDAILLKKKLDLVKRANIIKNVFFSKIDRELHIIIIITE